jgi:diadenosine tetraphosphatase ApaH/serine/threonine PP2A family protein phosphatase
VHYAIIGCVHGNREALLAVLKDIRERRIERTVSLGDVVGWGPRPLECIDAVQDACFISIRGDHDLGVLEGTDGFIDKTANVLRWTREQIDASPDAARRLAYLEKTLDSFDSGGIAFHHGSPRGPHEYLFPSDVRRDPRKLRAVFDLTDKVCFSAHTHVPGVITREPFSWQAAGEIDNYFHYRKGQKALVNVGSVGQPRDGDPRACYLEIKKNEMRWRRVEYDVSSVVSELQALPEVFGSDLAIRLQKGR